MKLDRLAVRIRGAEQARPPLVDAWIGEQRAERRGQPGMRRNDHLRDAEGGGDFAGVQRPRSAEGDEAELPRIEAPFNRQHSDRVRHVFIRDLDDRLGGLLHREADAASQLGNRGTRLGDVERHLAAEEEAGIEAAQDQIGIGDRRVRPSPSVAHGARIRPGALRPNLEQAALVNPGDRSAAGSDRDEVDDRGRDGE